MNAMPQTSPRDSSAAELLTLGLGAGLDDVDLEAEIELGEFLCACPDLELRSCLGRGGMGIVYRARQVRLDREVAVKLMSPELGRDPELGRRFEQEARALARLDHPGIVRVHDFGQAAGVYYLVMELVDGPNLRELIEQGLDDEQAATIVDQLCDALAYAHERGVVHRDIKPENVLVDRRGRVKVADFGLAKLQAERRAGATRTRRVLGTPQYMAPEQLRDPASVDQRCDIFAIGVVFYEMLTGQLPVGRFPAPSELGRGDAELDAIVLRALESNRERRYQAASEIRAALSSIGAGPHAVTEVQPLPPSRRWWPIAGVAGAAATAALAWGLSGSGEPAQPAALEAAALEATALEATASVEDVASAVVLDATKQLNRWPARELTILDPDVIGVAGVDWSELSQSPVVGQLSETLLADAPPELLRCKETILDRTHKVVVAFTSTKVRELVLHADWDPSELRTCLDELAGMHERDGMGLPEIVESSLGPHLRVVVRPHGREHEVGVTIAHRGSTVVVSLRDDVTVEELDAKLAGTPTSEALRDQVIHAVDLSAPIWVAAEPEPGLLPMDMLSIAGGIELWSQLGVDATATFADEAAATKAQTLVGSYANILSSVSDLPTPPEITVTRDGAAVRVRGTLVIPDLRHVRGEGLRLGLGRSGSDDPSQGEGIEAVVELAAAAEP